MLNLLLDNFHHSTHRFFFSPVSIFILPVVLLLGFYILVRATWNRQTQFARSLKYASLVSGGISLPIAVVSFSSPIALLFLGYNMVAIALPVFSIAWAAFTGGIYFSERRRSIPLEGTRGRLGVGHLVLASGILFVFFSVSVGELYSRRLNSKARSESSPVLRSVFESYWVRFDQSVASTLAANQACPKDILETLSKHDKTRVRAAVAKNPSTPSHVLEELADDKDNGVRGGVATNPSTPAALLQKVSQDREPWVRRQTLGNPSIPRELTLRLSKDPDLYTKKEAREVLKKRSF